MRMRLRRPAHVPGRNSRVLLAAAVIAAFAICWDLGQASAQGLEGACLLEPDSLGDLCPGAASLCMADGQVGETVRKACGATCGICKSERSADDDRLEAGEAVGLRTGFVLEEGSAYDQGQLDGFMAWLKYSGAQDIGLPVGNGRVVVNHTSEYATHSDGDCTDYLRAADRLIKDHKVQMAVIQTHTCKTELSKAYHTAGVIHFLQSGTDMRDSDGSDYGNKHAWYLHLSSDEYPRLFLKQMELDGFYNVAVVWYAGNGWTKASAETLVASMTRRKSSNNAYRQAEVVYTYEWPAVAGGRGFSKDAPYDTQLWDRMLMEMSDAGADVLIVYGIEEGASIMSRAYELKTWLHGVYMTLAPGKPTWAALGDAGNFVVTPGQWSDQAISPCVVFGSVSEYVKIFNGIFAYTPDYNVAMSSFAGVVMQLALQDAQSVVPDNILKSLFTLTEDTLMGRVRFAVEQRNIGRDPVLMQVQNEALQLVRPLALAIVPYASFVVWECRELYYDQDPSFCSDSEVKVFMQCYALYRDVIDGAACLVRLETDGPVVWEGDPIIYVCQMFEDSLQAQRVLYAYASLGPQGSLVFSECPSEWFVSSVFGLPKLKTLESIVVRDLIQEVGDPGILLPDEPFEIDLSSLMEMTGDLTISGAVSGLSVSMDRLNRIRGSVSLDGVSGGLYNISFPKLTVVDGSLTVKGTLLDEGGMPQLQRVGPLRYIGNANRTHDEFFITFPNLALVDGPLILQDNINLLVAQFPRLEAVLGDVWMVDNQGLVEASCPTLSSITGNSILVTENTNLAFLNLAQAKYTVDYCDTFAEGDMSGNDRLINVRTLWFEPENCEALRIDDKSNICPQGYVLVHGEQDESRCDEDWRSYFLKVLIAAMAVIGGTSFIMLYQEYQFRTFYCKPEFTNNKPIPKDLCGFQWHGAMATLLLGTVDKLSDAIFIQLQIKENACRDYKWVVYASLSVFVVTSYISLLRVIVEVLLLSRNQNRHIHFFPRPSEGRETRLIEWVWCVSNGFFNCCVVSICVVGLEPLKLLPWDRPGTRMGSDILAERDFMPDWYRYLKLKKMNKQRATHRVKQQQPESSPTEKTDEGEAVKAPNGGKVRQLRMSMKAAMTPTAPVAGTELRRQLYYYMTTLSFFDNTLGLVEDIVQFSLQVVFMTHCHPTEEAAVTTLLSVMFSLLRAGLKLTSALSDEIISDAREDIAKVVKTSISETVKGSTKSRFQRAAARLGRRNSSRSLDSSSQNSSTPPSSANFISVVQAAQAADANVRRLSLVPDDEECLHSKSSPAAIQLTLPEHMQRAHVKETHVDENQDDDDRGDEEGIDNNDDNNGDAVPDGLQPCSSHGEAHGGKEHVLTLECPKDVASDDDIYVSISAPEITPMNSSGGISTGVESRESHHDFDDAGVSDNAADDKLTIQIENPLSPSNDDSSQQ